MIYNSFNQQLDSYELVNKRSKKVEKGCVTSWHIELWLRIFSKATTGLQRTQSNIQVTGQQDNVGLPGTLISLGNNRCRIKQDRLA